MDAVNRPTLAALTAYFLRLGTLGFGGPIALAGAMERDLVEERRWFTPDEYRSGLTLAQIAPGPLAAQLAIYLGWVTSRLRGATAVAIAFVLPSFVMVVILGALYRHYGHMPWMRAAFYGVGAAVIAIMARSAYRLTFRTMSHDVALWAVFAVNALTTAITERELVSVILASGAGILLLRWRPRAALSVAVPVLWQIAIYFTEAGAFVFGSGLAIVPFLHDGVVNRYGWLTEAQFVDAVAVAMITPGPVVITVAFIGYLVAGLAGACVAAVAVFAPCYLFVVIPAPFYKQIVGNTHVRSFVDGVTAAAVGAIAGAVVVLGRRAIVDWGAAAICVVALVVLTLSRRTPEPLVVVGAGAIGIATALV